MDEVLDKDVVCHRLYSTYTANTLEGFGDLKIGRQIIHSIKYAANFVLLAKEETVLQGMIDRLTGIGKTLWNGNEGEKN